MRGRQGAQRGAALWAQVDGGVPVSGDVRSACGRRPARVSLGVRVGQSVRAPMS